MEAPAAPRNLAGGFGHLPNEIQEKVFAFAVEAKWGSSMENNTDGRNDRLVLKCDGLSLTCKGLRSLWSSIIWTAHPKSVSVLAAEPKVKLLHKIGSLLTIKVFARHDAIAADLLTFQQSLLGNSPGTRVSLVSRFPSLQKLSLNPITVGVNFKKLPKEDLAKCGRYAGDFLFNFVLDEAKEPADVDVYYCSLPRQQYNLDLLSEKTPTLLLECGQFPLPQSLAGFHGVSLVQYQELDGHNTKAIKASNIKSFEVDSFGPEGCRLGNQCAFDTLAHLPNSLEKLVLRRATHFPMPRKFPPGLANLTSLELNGCKWNTGNASNCLPAGLTSLDISFHCATEDGSEYTHLNFSLSGLPRALQTLKLDCKKPLIGPFVCPQLKTFVTSSLPPSLPESLTSLTLDCTEPVVMPLNCPLLKTLVIKGQGGLPSVLPASLTHLTLSLTRRDVEHPDKAGVHSLSLLTLSASCPALEQLSLLPLEGELRHGPDEDPQPPSLPAVEGDLTCFASLRQVRCSDAVFLAALQALPHNNVSFADLEEEGEGEGEGEGVETQGGLTERAAVSTVPLTQPYSGAALIHMQDFVAPIITEQLQGRVSL